MRSNVRMSNPGHYGVRNGDTHSRHCGALTSPFGGVIHLRHQDDYDPHTAWTRSSTSPRHVGPVEISRDSGSAEASDEGRPTDRLTPFCH